MEVATGLGLPLLPLELPCGNLQSCLVPNDDTVDSARLVSNLVEYVKLFYSG